LSDAFSAASWTASLARSELSSIRSDALSLPFSILSAVWWIRFAVFSFTPLIRLFGFWEFWTQ